LIYLIGNENNYGLFWDNKSLDLASIRNKESAPNTMAMYKLFLMNQGKKKEQSQSAELEDDTKSILRAKAMYSLMNEAAELIKSKDENHPVAISNGALMFLDIIKEECTGVDIFGTNIYRGISFGDSFQRVKSTLNKPILFTEFGADAYNDISQREDQELQAYYLKGNLKEIYANADGVGGARNCLGGVTFEFSDDWWKTGRTENLDIHDNGASWSSDAYFQDYEKGKNNMNEEWFGICSKSRVEKKNRYKLRPRAAYFLLKEVHQFKTYSESSSLVELEKLFSEISIERAKQNSMEFKGFD
ncbi:MAG: hypothetical protein AAGC47_15055, partial [Bacteroidota bacterium]